MAWLGWLLLLFYFKVGRQEIKHFNCAEMKINNKKAHTLIHTHIYIKKTTKRISQKLKKSVQLFLHLVSFLNSQCFLFVFLSFCFIREFNLESFAKDVYRWSFLNSFCCFLVIFWFGLLLFAFCGIFISFNWHLLMLLLLLLLFSYTTWIYQVILWIVWLFKTFMV